MILFPAIDILEGRAVRLFKGDKSRVTDYGESIILQTCCGDNAHYRVVIAV